MSAGWEAVVARARGLSSRLIGAEALRRLAALSDHAALARALRETEYATVALPERPAAADIDRAGRRLAAARLRILTPWLRSHGDATAFLFEDEDRRSIRALVRGAAGGVPPELRVAGLVPTLALPEGALQRLSRLSTPGAVAATLVAWGSPYGSPILAHAGGAHPDLFAIDHTLAATFLARALAVARRGGRALVAHVRRLVDAENLLAALMLAREGADRDPETTFHEGGAAIERAAFVAAARAEDQDAAAAVLADAVVDPALAEATRPAAKRRGGVEDAILRGLARDAVRRARREPLGPAPLLAYVLRLRGEITDVRRIAWGIELGAERTSLASELVSP